eukprot:3938236-Rhodomonas_salina.2
MTSVTIGCALYASDKWYAIATGACAVHPTRVAMLRSWGASLRMRAMVTSHGVRTVYAFTSSIVRCHGCVVMDMLAFCFTEFAAQVFFV